MTKGTVLVVGAGPVGLTLAAELSRYGVPVRVVDKAAARTDKSKAIVLWPRTLELLERAGCSAKFVAAGFQVTATNLIAGGKQVAHIHLDEVQTPYPFALMLPQSETERLLEEHLKELGVSVEREVELLRFAEAEDRAGVAVTLRHAGGREEQAHVSWLIGCDGAHSSVRHGLGVEFAGDTLASRWILADVHLTGRETPENELDIYLHSAGVLLFFPLSGGRYRLIADVSSSASGAAGSAPTLAEVQAIIDERGPGGMQASRPVWLGGFTINERKVKSYRAGRVLLAGDAAHVHSPAGGQGMNTGMQDAINLAWKLALVSADAVTSETLLDSYSSERGEIARQVLADAGNLTTLGTLKGALTQAVRNKVMSLVFGFSAAHHVMADKLTELAVAYPRSPLTHAEKAVHFGPSAGGRVPPTGRMSQVSRTPRFALCAKHTPESAALLARHPTLLDPELHAPFNEEALWLVRPDGYVALTAAPEAWQQVEAYLSRLSSR